MKLLKKLGWKQGQGVGPRLSRKEKRAAKNKKTKDFSSSSKAIHYGM